MSGLHKAKKSKKLRKVGRNANYFLAYKNSNRSVMTIAPRSLSAITRTFLVFAKRNKPLS